MSIVPIGHLQLTQADVTVLLKFGQNLIRKRLASACVPSATDDGTPVVVFLNSTGYHLLYAVCREFGFYYAVDRDGAVLAESQLLHELIEALPENRHMKGARQSRLSQTRARKSEFICLAGKAGSVGQKHGIERSGQDGTPGPKPEMRCNG